MKLKPSKLFNYVITLGIVGLAGWACFSLYNTRVTSKIRGLEMARFAQTLSRSHLAFPVQLYGLLSETTNK
jgi:hypothetical protein